VRRLAEEDEARIAHEVDERVQRANGAVYVSHGGGSLRAAVR
jgi:hypothetical protein